MWVIDSEWRNSPPTTTTRSEHQIWAVRNKRSLKLLSDKVSAVFTSFKGLWNPSQELRSITYHMRSQCYLPPNTGEHVLFWPQPNRLVLYVLPQRDGRLSWLILGLCHWHNDTMIGDWPELDKPTILGLTFICYNVDAAWISIFFLA